LKAQLSKVGSGAAGVAKTVADTVAGIVTVFVLAYLMVLEGPKLVAGTLALLPEGRRHRGAARGRRLRAQPDRVRHRQRGQQHHLRGVDVSCWSPACRSPG